MTFGNLNTIAIQIGEIDADLDPKHVYIRFRFVLFGRHLGDWDNYISLITPLTRMKNFLSCREFRRDDSFRNLDSKTFFERTFTDFYEYDYTNQPPVVPDYRQRYHLSGVGGDSIFDLYGIVVVDVSPEKSRVVVQDLRTEQIILDEEINSKEIETMGRDFVEWAQRVYDKK